jgi:acetyl-CoA synthetase
VEVERFPPPDEFRERAAIADGSIYERAERDYEGFWAEQAQALHWDQRWDTVLDEANPPFYGNV